MNGRALVVALLLAGCAEAPPPAAEVCPVLPPIETPRRVVAAPAPGPSMAETDAVIQDYRTHLAEVARYATWRNSKPRITDKLGNLTATATSAVRLLQQARTPKARAAALPPALAAVQALDIFLQTKGD